MLKGEDLPERFVAQDSVFAEAASQDRSFARGNLREAEYCDTSLPDLEFFLDSLPCFTTQETGSQQLQSPSLNPWGATASSYTFLSTNENTGGIQTVAGDMDKPLSISHKKVFVSLKQSLPNTGPSKASSIKTENVCSSKNMAHLSDPFTLPLHSHRGVLNPCLTSTNTRRRSDTGSYMQCPPSSFTHGNTPKKRLSMGAEPIWTNYPYLNSQDGFIDSHCHLDMLYGKLGFSGTFSSFRKLYQSSFPPAFRGCITNFCNPRLMVKEALWEGLLAEDMVWGAFGCHPHFANDYSNVHECNILMAMRHPKAVAFGEMGLDYSHKNSTDTSRQKEVSSSLIYSDL